MKHGLVERKTRETEVSVEVTIDGKGIADISTGIGFFDHMLTALSVHSGISMNIKCQGDLYVDGHHTVEDTGIVLGQALAQALGDKSGIVRYGSAYIPMDEALGFCSLDISNRPFLVFNGEFTNQMIGEYDTCLTKEFFRAFAVNAGITLHVNMVYGKNDHHKCESVFKAVAHALKMAVKETGSGETLSTKGGL
ncbi:imidazoleglycerol-phosphate dehydratase HisB [Porcipelethomonas ammoniilytica]|uniref:imidazoleglycerol-phosphate dehydratase HisB n=1 Tax=Porcipelethomonas ammoniilytica TaxID=2981722 RepID=UPI000820C284|nr:imidazoleglycerol-phosphate dehydratase HisB [Porcipelethomonas ammoniilytica]MCU6718386.1 imidazoleglycerol-phosphate dehydratase HisB [Porcipelethomonas ammoniilytica]SCI50162.1 Imidazoleglycerol-phosphate dehydratase [uncultured Ruminococcus sp.]